MKETSRRQKEPGSRAAVGRSFGLALLMFALTSALARSQPDSKITVRVYNYAQVSGGTLAGAQTEAGRIFGAAGVDAVWLDCSASGGQPRSEANPGCAGPFGGTNFVLRILPSSTPAKAAFRDTVFGFAEGTDVASVFYGRITNLAHGSYGDNREAGVILGDVISHELGHLLLGTSSHSPTGIMCAKWDGGYLRLALMGRQVFTLEQSALLRANVLRRHEGAIQTSLANSQP